MPIRKRCRVGENAMPKANILQRAVATVLLVSAAAGVANANADDDRIAALQAKYRCPIFDYLEAIHKYPTPQRTNNRYLIVTIDHRIDQRYYAQCAFEKLDRRMICEVSSPSFNPEFKSTYFAKARLPTIRALGYHARRKDNYYQRQPAESPEALYKIAGLLVETLGRVFDMQSDEALTYEAPLVPKPPEPSEEGSRFCSPQISLR